MSRLGKKIIDCVFLLGQSSVGFPVSPTATNLDHPDSLTSIRLVFSLFVDPAIKLLADIMSTTKRTLSVNG